MSIWVPVLVGVLAVVGAWGSQIIAGRNERGRWEREHAREAEAHWRMKRLEVYSDYLRAVDLAAESAKRHIGLSHRAGVTTTVGDALARLDEAYVPLEIIGSDEADAMTTRLSVALLMLALGLDLDHEPGKSAAPDRDAEADVREIQRLREGLRAQFRKDLAVVLPSKPGGRRRLRWRGPKVLTANGNLAERE